MADSNQEYELTISGKGHLENCRLEARNNQIQVVLQNANRKNGVLESFFIRNFTLLHEHGHIHWQQSIDPRQEWIITIKAKFPIVLKNENNREDNREDYTEVIDIGYPY